MSKINYRQVYAIRSARKNELQKIEPRLNSSSGIYVLTRYDDYNYVYVGQTINLIERMIDHLTKYDGNIDHSIRKRKLYSEENKAGWKIEKVLYYSVKSLNEAERVILKEYVSNGYIPYNDTKGGQDSGKGGLVDREPKGYNKGLHNGYNKARKDIAKLFDKNLVAVINGSTNKNKEKALEKFKEFLEV